MTSSNLKRSPSSPRSNLNAQPPEPSAPPGSSITPSTVVNWETISLPWESSCVCRYHVGQPRDPKLIEYQIRTGRAALYEGLAADGHP